MAISVEHYGTLTEANEFFTNRLHETAWTVSDTSDRAKALIAATEIIDALNFKGAKAAVYSLLQSNCEATLQEQRDADATQTLQFPRDNDTVIPESIRRACYEIAHALLDDRDPEIELENLSATSHSIGRISTKHDRTSGPAEHLVNGVPSVTAWRLLRPFVRDGSRIRLRRTS